MSCGPDPLAFHGTLAVSHLVVDVVRERLGLSEVAVDQQVDVEVRHSYRVDGRGHGEEDTAVNFARTIWLAYCDASARRR
jgi:hypothetical protein